MNACCSTPTAAAAPDDINVSCRAPLFVLFGKAVGWLVAASVLGLVASLKFHSPNILANCACLTYGRVHAAAVNAQLYGFAVPAGLGVALWIIAQLGGIRVVQPGIIAFGAALWNIGVLIGVIGILAGDSTGFEKLEMPRYAAVILLLAFLLIGVATLFTLHDRRERRLTPPQWFLIAALFWFPWIFSTAYLLLTVCPVRGVMQPVIQWWFGGNFTFVWLSLTGLAAVFHFLPQFAGRTLHSSQLALFTFWTLILFGSWTGIPASAPLPAWMPALSGIATLLTLVTLISVGVNIFHTKQGGRVSSETSSAYRFVLFGLGMFQLAGLMRIASVLPPVSAVTNFTWFTVAQAQLNSFGFFSLVMLGAIYHIVPRVAGAEWPSAKSVRLHFWLAAVGILLVAVPLALGGVAQGFKLLDPAIAFQDVSKATLPFLRAATTGELLILFGNLLLAANLLGLVVRCFRAKLVPAFASVTAEMKFAEVKP